MKPVRLLPALSLTLCLSASAAEPAPSATARRAFTIADVARAKAVGHPAISPDGKTVVYEVTTSDMATAKRKVNLWRVDADGKNARPLTTGETRDESPVFTPDGTTLLFVSSRSGDPQLWALPMEGGEPEKKTDVPGGLAAPVVSPDGKRVAFAVDVYPECGVDLECTRKTVERHEKSKFNAHLSDRLLYRHWTDWRDFRRTHLFVMDLAAGKPVDVTPGDFDSPPFNTGGAGDYVFSPDGKELVFVSNRDADEASSTNGDLWAVPVDGTPEQLKSPAKLTPKNAAWDGLPTFSPDGRWLAFRHQSIPGYESDRLRLSLLDRKTGEVKPLTDSFDNWVRDYAFSPDGRKVYFTADVRGRTPLHELELATGKVRIVSNVGHVDAFDVSPDGRFAVVSRRRFHEPHELHRIELASGAETRLTTHNLELEKEVDFRPGEEVFVDGADGKKVQVWLIKPHGFDPAKKYPVILNVHGGPQQQWEDAFRGDWQVYPGAGYVVAVPNPHGSTGFGQAYTAAISDDWDGKVMTDIEKVTDWLKAQPYVDAGRMGAMGWSWGGYAMMWLEGRPNPFKALASMMGVYDLRSMYSGTEELWFPQWDLGGAPWEKRQSYLRRSPSEYVTAFKTPCLVITGERDFRVPYQQSLMFFTDLQKRKVPSRLIVFEKAGHWPSWYEMLLYYAAHLDWFHSYLGGDPSPWNPADLVKGAPLEGAAK